MMHPPITAMEKQFELTPDMTKEMSEKINKSLNYFTLHGSSQDVENLTEVQDFLNALYKALLVATKPLVEHIPQMTDLNPEIFYDAIKDVLGFTKEQLRHKNKKRDVANARFIFCSLIKEFTHYSLTQIGIMLGGKDHSTIIHARKKCGYFIETEPDFREKYKLCRQHVLNEITKLRTIEIESEDKNEKI